MREIRHFDPQTAARGEWDALHRFRRLRVEEDTPGEPFTFDADFEADVKREWPLWQNRRLMAWRDGAIIGNCGHSFRRPGSPGAESHAAHINLWGGVLAPHRRQGLATALLRATLPFIDAMGKTIISLGTSAQEGRHFLAAIGAEEKHRSVENRLSLTSLDWPMLEAWRAAPLPAGLAWEVHTPRAPLERLAALYPQFTALLNTVPIGALEAPPMRYEITGTTTWYGELDRHGGAHHLILLMQGETVAGICEASHDARFPDRVFQALTAVAPAWRGQGLAKHLKAAMLFHIRAAHPEAVLMITSNANVNAPMLSINTRLGFRQHRQDSAWQISRDALARHLNALKLRAGARPPGIAAIASVRRSRLRLSRQPMQPAQLVAVGVAQIRQIHLPARPHARRLLDRHSAVLHPGLVPGVHQFRAVDAKPDRAAIRPGRRLAVDRLGDQQQPALVRVDQPAFAIHHGRLRADRPQHGVIEFLRSRNIIAADHDVTEHGSFPSIV